MSEPLQTLSTLKALSEMIRELQVRSEERLKAQHGRFNIFTTLLSPGDEVRLHTRFLHELLNPEGNHDCGDLFLNLFFETLDALQPVSHDDIPASISWDGYAKTRYQVGKEVRKKQGQLDLLLESDSHVLVIENKIWAGEGEKQVARYAEFVADQGEKGGQVLYLTLDGKPSASHGDNAYLRISYREHIMDWLERCLQATYRMIPINQALIQYREVVKHLTGLDADSETMKEITDFIRVNPGIISQVAKLEAGVEALRFELVGMFFEELKLELGKYYEVKPRPGMRPNHEPYPGLVIDLGSDAVLNELPGEIWIELNPWDALFIGLETKWRKDEPVAPEQSLRLANIATTLQRLCVESSYHYAALDKTWTGTHWPLGGHDLKEVGFSRPPEATTGLLNSAARVEIINEVVDDVSVYLDRLREAIRLSAQA